MEGFAAQDLENGVRHVAIHYSADPAKTEEWKTKTRKNMASEGKGQRDWDREMELRDDIYDGEPVFSDYADSWHCPREWREKHYPIHRNSQWVCGIDGGQSLTPAATLVQITPRGQIQSALEVLSEGNEAMSKFAPRLLRAVTDFLPTRWDEIEFVGDFTLGTRNGTDGRTSVQEAAKHGIHIKPLTNSWEARRSSMTWALCDELDETTPRYLISALGCPTLRTGFKGAYKLNESASGDVIGPGRVLKMPVKNGYSHVQDGNQQAIQRARKIVMSPEFKRGGLRS
jgi:hypothetical protein